MVTTTTILIDASRVLFATAGYNLPSGNRSVAYYPTIGGIGQRNFTNRYYQSTVNTLALDPLGEDYESNQLWLTTPYASSLSWHLNGPNPILTPGGILATDISSFINPYPIESTGYGFGVGGSSQSLNNDPSKTFFASSAPGFTASTYSNVPIANITGTSVGTVAGAPGPNSLCVASFERVGYQAYAPGIRVYNFAYSLRGGNTTAYYTVSANLQLITDGTVNTDQLGNQYFQVAAASGYRVYTWTNGTVQTVNVTAVLPVCSGPTVSSAPSDNFYCNNNRLFPQPPYLDRLGLAFEMSANIPLDGQPPAFASTNIYGVYVYRETAIEEAHPAYNGAFPVWSDNPAQSISLVQQTTPRLPAGAVGLHHAVPPRHHRLPLFVLHRRDGRHRTDAHIGQRYGQHHLDLPLCQLRLAGLPYAGFHGSAHVQESVWADDDVQCIGDGAG